MSRMILGRLVFMAVAALFVVTVLFGLFHVIPGDPALLLAGDNAPLEVVDGIRRAYGFDEPLPVQYGRYLSRLLRGDLGVSNFSREPVLRVVLPRFWNTVQLAVLAMLLAMTASLFLGCTAAMFWNTRIDRGVTVLSLLGICTPVFVSGLVAIFVFAVKLGWLPTGGMTSWRSYVLPVLTLGAFQAAVLTRMVRATMVDALEQDYITTARAKGASELAVVFRHALRNALIPILTLFGLGFGATLGGSVVTETIFTWPGLGRLTVESILSRDLPVTQGALLLFGLVFITVNLVVDVLYAYVDPRIHHG